MVTNRKRLEKLSDGDLAMALVFDEEGNERASCAVCAYAYNCNDNCYQGVLEYLQQESK